MSGCNLGIIKRLEIISLANAMYCTGTEWDFWSWVPWSLWVPSPQDIPWIWKAPGTQCPAGAEANLAAFPWNILAFLLIPTACLSCFPEGHVPATSVATRMGIPFFLNSEMTLFLSLWSMSPWSSPRLWSSCLRLLASSSALAFLVTKRRTLPEDVNSTRRRVSQFHLLGPEGKISTIWVTSSFAWGQKCPQSQEGGSNTQTSHTFCITSNTA